MAGWTCPECGLDYDSVAPGDIPVSLRSFPRRYRAAVAGFTDDETADALVHRRPDDKTWSVVEYIAHVADLWELFAVGLQDMANGRPVSVEVWDPDARATSERYNDRAADAVLDELTAAAERLADVLDDVHGEAWSNTFEFEWGERDLLTMARNAVHEGRHHLRDVEQVRAAVLRRT